LANNNSKKNNIISVIVFLILTLTLAVFCITVFRMKKPSDNTEKISETTADSETISEENRSEETAENISDEIQDEENSDINEEVPDNNSDEEISVKSEWSEIIEAETDQILDISNDNHFKFDLDQLLEIDDIAESFSFELHVEDGETSLGEIKCGLGFSVKENCPDTGIIKWYNSVDNVFSTEESSCTIEYIIPDEVKEYIDPSGELLFGYWWGDNKKIVVDKIICHRTKAGMEMPDNTPEEADPQETE